MYPITILCIGLTDTKEDRTATTSKVRSRYHSPTGRYCNSLAVVQEFAANSELTAIGSDAGTSSILSMDKSGLEYYPTPRKGVRMQAILDESTIEDQLESPENCIIFTKFPLSSSAITFRTIN